MRKTPSIGPDIKSRDINEAHAYSGRRLPLIPIESCH
jgi:hypothetical protein